MPINNQTPNPHIQRVLVAARELTQLEVDAQVPMWIGPSWPQASSCCVMHWLTSKRTAQDTRLDDQKKQAAIPRKT